MTHGTGTGTDLWLRPREGVGQLPRLTARARGRAKLAANAVSQTETFAWRGMRVIIIKSSLPFEISSPTPFGKYIRTNYSTDSSSNNRAVQFKPNEQLHK